MRKANGKNWDAIDGSQEAEKKENFKIIFLITESGWESLLCRFFHLWLIVYGWCCCCCWPGSDSGLDHIKFTLSDHKNHPISLFKFRSALGENLCACHSVLKSPQVIVISIWDSQPRGLLNPRSRQRSRRLSAFACSSSFVCNENNTSINNNRGPRQGPSRSSSPGSNPNPCLDIFATVKGIKMHNARCVWPMPMALAISLAIDVLSRRHTLLGDPRSHRGSRVGAASRI